MQNRNVLPVAYVTTVISDYKFPTQIKHTYE
jgi:hypothetical protein